LPRCSPDETEALVAITAFSPVGVAAGRGYLLRLGVVATAYVVAGKVGITLSVAHGVITPVWAPSGIALAALLIFGRSLWPGVAVGAFLTNATSGAEPLVAAGIAAGNTLEALAGSFLLEKVRFRIDLGRVRDVLALVVLAAGLSTLISATNGVAVLSVAGVARGSIGSDWLLWWFGDAVGILMVTPFLLLAYTHRRTVPTRARALEMAALLLVLAAISSFVFLGGAWRYPYLLFPPLLWAALRFQQLGATACCLLVGALATWGTVVGRVPIHDTSATGRVQVIQALVGVLAISLLLLGATLAEREAANRAVEQTAARLSEAQALTHIGSWDWDIATGEVNGSDELYRIFGLTPQSVGITASFALERFHPADRASFSEHVQQAVVRRNSCDLELRIVLADGRTRLLHVRGRVLLDDSGEPKRMVGTAQDITERRQAETLRDDILSTVSHELRTPLASVLNFALTLQAGGRGSGEAAAARIVDRIVEQTRRIDRLLSDLLELDRFRHDRVVALREPTDVARLVEQIAAAHQGSAHAISVSTEPTTANVDTTQVERIVDNLVANAVKHTPSGTPIDLRLERRGEDLLIVVDDAGPGIPDDHKAAVFEVFDRGAKVRSSEPGTGIGLSLVARFAALHEGRAWVEDASTGGASVRVLLPNCILETLSSTRTTTSA
jgi:PAS domain S-box-containing protein